ncbi:hypothetical protein SLOPH_2188 [Spraguea lophii 42_110]|uniref:Uncharacterized protein n=1 Tax=Spraguea lophii (strain 42_110) TaxID=1358809 RepID=S7W4T8_SPRLO|nr:hypothetical protein SLOPH_2188 [Spraguea lophii 42_110]
MKIKNMSSYFVNFFIILTVNNFTQRNFVFCSDQTENPNLPDLTTSTKQDQSINVQGGQTLKDAPIQNGENPNLPDLSASPIQSQNAQGEQTLQNAPIQNGENPTGTQINIEGENKSNEKNKTSEEVPKDGTNNEGNKKNGFKGITSVFVGVHFMVFAFFILFK